MQDLLRSGSWTEPRTKTEPSFPRWTKSEPGYSPPFLDWSGIEPKIKYKGCHFGKQFSVFFRLKIKTWSELQYKNLRRKICRVEIPRVHVWKRLIETALSMETKSISVPSALHKERGPKAHDAEPRYPGVHPWSWSHDKQTTVTTQTKIPCLRGR